MLRVDAGDSLWHAVLDSDGRPERVQVRVGSGPDAVDATFTFFDNEVLVWRKGAQPAVEAIPLATPVRLAWAPTACRDVLGQAPVADGAMDGSASSGESSLFVIRIVDREQGGVVGTPAV